ncbi:MAG: TetR/AcrR family transcriptional regulator [Bacillota bacterium]
MSKNIVEEIRREQITNATKKLILTKGYNNFSMKDLAAELEMSAGIMYHYFTSKEDILFEVLKDSFFRGPYMKVMETVSPLQTFPEKILSYLDTVNRSIKEDLEFYLLIVIYIGQVTYAPKTSMLLEKFLNNLRSFVRDILQLGVEQGFLEEDMINSLPELIIANYMGLVLQIAQDQQALNLDNALMKNKELILRYLGIK